MLNTLAMNLPLRLIILITLFSFSIHAEPLPKVSKGKIEQDEEKILRDAGINSDYVCLQCNCEVSNRTRFDVAGSVGCNKCALDINNYWAKCEIYAENNGIKLVIDRTCKFFQLSTKWICKQT